MFKPEACCSNGKGISQEDHNGGDSTSSGGDADADADAEQHLGFGQEHEDSVINLASSDDEAEAATEVQGQDPELVHQQQATAETLAAPHAVAMPQPNEAMAPLSGPPKPPAVQLAAQCQPAQHQPQQHRHDHAQQHTQQQPPPHASLPSVAACTPMPRTSNLAAALAARGSGLSSYSKPSIRGIKRPSSCLDHNTDAAQHASLPGTCSQTHQTPRPEPSAADMFAVLRRQLQCHGIAAGRATTGSASSAVRTAAEAVVKRLRLDSLSQEDPATQQPGSGLSAPAPVNGASQHVACLEGALPNGGSPLTAASMSVEQSQQVQESAEKRLKLDASDSPTDASNKPSGQLESSNPSTQQPHLQLTGSPQLPAVQLGSSNTSGSKARLPAQSGIASRCKPGVQQLPPQQGSVPPTCSSALLTQLRQSRQTLALRAQAGCEQGQQAVSADCERGQQAVSVAGTVDLTMCSDDSSDDEQEVGMGNAQHAASSDPQQQEEKDIQLQAKQQQQQQRQQQQQQQHHIMPAQEQQCTMPTEGTQQEPPSAKGQFQHTEQAATNAVQSSGAPVLLQEGLLSGGQAQTLHQPPARGPAVMHGHEQQLQRLLPQQLPAPVPQHMPAPVTTVEQLNTTMRAFPPWPEHKPPLSDEVVLALRSWSQDNSAALSKKYRPRRGQHLPHSMANAPPGYHSVDLGTDGELNALLLAPLGEQMQRQLRTRDPTVEARTTVCYVADPCDPVNYNRLPKPLGQEARMPRGLRAAKEMPEDEELLLGAYFGQIKTQEQDAREVAMDETGLVGVRAAYTHDFSWSLDCVLDPHLQLAVVADATCRMSLINDCTSWVEEMQRAIGTCPRAALNCCTCAEYSGRQPNVKTLQCVYKTTCGDIVPLLLVVKPKGISIPAGDDILLRYSEHGQFFPTLASHINDYNAKRRRDLQLAAVCDALMQLAGPSKDISSSSNSSSSRLHPALMLQALKAVAAAVMPSATSQGQDGRTVASAHLQQVLAVLDAADCSPAEHCNCSGPGAAALRALTQQERASYSQQLQQLQRRLEEEQVLRVQLQLAIAQNSADLQQVEREKDALGASHRDEVAELRAQLKLQQQQHAHQQHQQQQELQKLKKQAEAAERFKTEARELRQKLAEASKGAGCRAGCAEGAAMTPGRIAAAEARARAEQQAREAAGAAAEARAVAAEGAKCLAEGKLQQLAMYVTAMQEMFSSGSDVAAETATAAPPAAPLEQPPLMNGLPIGAS